MCGIQVTFIQNFKNMADLKHRVEIKSSAEKVFQAITTKKGLESWWTSDVEIDDVKKEYTFGFGRHSIFIIMKVEKEVPGEYVGWKCYGELEEWMDTRLIFEILDGKAGVIELNFTHANWKSTDGSFSKCNTDWGHLMYYLKDYTEGRNHSALMGG